MFARLTFTRKLIRFGNTLLWGAVCATLGFYGGATFMTNSTDEEFKSLASQVKTLRAWEAKVARGEEKLRSALTQLVSNAPAHPPMYTRAGTPKQTGIGGGRERHSKMYRSGKLDMSLVEAVLSGTRVNGGQLYSGGDLSGLSLLLRSLPLGYPVDGPISSVFGHRISPISGSPQLHTGLDFSVVSSTPVHATAEGVIREAGFKGDYGRCVVIDHGLGFETLYAHLSAIDVAVGSRVARGDKIGRVGSSGSSTGPHLHYEVRRENTPTNPLRFIDFPRSLRVHAQEVEAAQARYLRKHAIKSDEVTHTSAEGSGTEDAPGAQS